MMKFKGLLYEVLVSLVTLVLIKNYLNCDFVHFLAFHNIAGRAFDTITGSCDKEISCRFLPCLCLSSVLDTGNNVHW